MWLVDVEHMIQQEEDRGSYKYQQRHLHCRLFVNFGDEIGSGDVDRHSRRERKTRTNIVTENRHGEYTGQG